MQLMGQDGPPCPGPVALWPPASAATAVAPGRAAGLDLAT